MSQENVEIQYFDIRGDRAAGVYRQRRGDGRFELWKGGEWIVVVPSEQDYDHLRQITSDEASRRIGDPAAVVGGD